MSELLKVFEFTARQARELAAEQSVTDTPIVIGEVTIVPVSGLSCGFSCGGSDLAKKTDGIMAGAGAKVARTPMTFLAVCGTDVRLLRVPPQEQSKGGLLAALRPLAEQLMAKKKSDGTKADSVSDGQDASKP